MTRDRRRTDPPSGVAPSPAGGADDAPGAGAGAGAGCGPSCGSSCGSADAAAPLGDTGPGGRAFRVRGMDCADEIAALKAALGPRAGGEERIGFDLLRARMVVHVDEGELPTKEILAAVARTGMTAIPWDEGGADASPVSRARVASLALAGALLVAGASVHLAIAGAGAAAAAGGAGVAHRVPLAAVMLYAAAVAASLLLVLPKAWASLRSLRPDMNLLMTTAVVGAILIDEWFEAAAVSFLFALALWLEGFSVGRARRAVSSLLASAPAAVRRFSADGAEERVAPEEVAVGSLFVVRPGEKIPLDGVVTEGESDVDQAPITGESVPVAKGVGGEVFAGTVNGTGALTVRSTRTADRTMLAKIVRLVTEAQSRRAPAEQWVDRFARRYTPAVLLLALSVFLVPPLFGAGFGESFYRALVLLVIACPCALVISTPVTIVAGLAAASRHGVLVKGGVHLESPARLVAVALDKTGTITEGRPAVVGVVPFGGRAEAEVLALAAALSSRSEHPLAGAIRRAARERGLEAGRAGAYRAVPGRGAEGEVDGRPAWIGSPRFLAERGAETPEAGAAVARAADANHTVVLVGDADGAHGLIALADRPRPGAAAAVAALRAAGIRRVALLTGDGRRTGEAIAREVGIEEVHAELLPEEKVAVVERMAAEAGGVAMVGDGVNDAPAMAVATVSIAMGAAGSDTAIETADVALMSDDLDHLPWLVRHSRRTLSTVRRNIALALGVKALFVALTLLGHATLWAAIAADMGTSLLVTFLGLRLLRPAPSPAAPAPAP